MDADAQVVHGAGVLVANGQVLTCAHVIARALGAYEGNEAPAGVLQVDFPGFGVMGETLGARIAPSGWHPVRDGGRDIAILDVVGGPPAGTQPPLLRRCGQRPGRHVQVYGYPKDIPDGVWAEARLAGPGGPNAEWVQLDGRGQHPIGAGFTGAGVIDLDTGEVIGCVIRLVRPESGIKVAWMTPLETVVGYLPPHLNLLGPAHPVPRHLGASPDSADAVPHDRPGALNRDEQAMIAALLALDGTRTQSWRDDLATRLTASLGPFFAVPPWRGEIEGVASLVTACLAQPGAMHELLVELHRWYGAPPPRPLRELDQLVLQNVPEPLLTPLDRRALYELIAGASVARAAEAYRRAVGPLGKPLSAHASDAIAIARVLEALNGPPGGLPPLVAFTASLARAALPGEAGKIRQWVERYLARNQLSEQLVVPYDVGYAPSAPSPFDPSYLVIRLTEDLREKDRFLLTAWLQHGARLGRPLRREDKPRRLDQVRTVMDDLLTEARQGLPVPTAVPTAVPMVEFILPRNLLGCAFDQWPAGRGNPEKRLGEVFPVVVRSLERMSDSEILPQWAGKWAWAAANCGGADPLAVSWLFTEGELTARRLYEGLAGDRPVCIALGYPPGRPHGLSRDEISVGLQAGVPIMVWCREGEPNAISAELIRLVSGHGLLELPQLVASRRAAAGRARESRPGAASNQAGGDDLGNHITLVFDPADRIPDSESLNRAPQ